MKVSGFTIVRNAIRYDYPVVESITSILPCVDEMVVAVGHSEDDTLALIQSINSPKIRIIETVWDESLREGGQVLAVETDKALAACDPTSTWCFYIQADEVFHEQYHPALVAAMRQYAGNPAVEGLLFGYVHFYGSYGYVGDSSSWYRQEIRVIRRNLGIHSYKDAQGFRKNGAKLRVKRLPVFMFHYGWVRSPFYQQEKQKSFQKLWHSDGWIENHVSQASEYDYSVIDSVAPFTGSHPATMAGRLGRMNWKFEFDPSKKRLKMKEIVLQWVEKTFGIRLFEYRNFVEI